MKILILVSIITWSFGGGYQDRPSAKIVSSIENAALSVFVDTQKDSILTEPDQKKYKLYELDITTNKVTEIKIPELIFKVE